MKDNRMRQTRNKWNNRGPRQVKLLTLTIIQSHTHFLKTCRAKFRLKTVNHQLLFSLHGKSLKRWISPGSTNFLCVLARKLLICNQLFKLKPFTC
jgi:hypothetical protein